MEHRRHEGENCPTYAQYTRQEYTQYIYNTCTYTYIYIYIYAHYVHARSCSRKDLQSQNTWENFDIVVVLLSWKKVHIPCLCSFSGIVWSGLREIQNSPSGSYRVAKIHGEDIGYLFCLGHFPRTRLIISTSCVERDCNSWNPMHLCPPVLSEQIPGHFGCGVVPSRKSFAVGGPKGSGWHYIHIWRFEWCVMKIVRVYVHIFSLDRILPTQLSPSIHCHPPVSLPLRLTVCSLPPTHFPREEISSQGWVFHPWVFRD